MDYNEFAGKVKAKYPEYQDMDNKELSQKIIEKYPEYKDQVTFEKPSLKGKIEAWSEKIEQDNQRLNEEVKARAKEKLRKRDEWEQKHPFISGVQKDYQLPFMGNPSYRGQRKKWEFEAQYGLPINAPIGEHLKNEASILGQNLVAPVNITVDALTGGEGAVARNGVKLSVKELIKNGIKQGAKTGFIGGSTQGITSSLADNGISMDLVKRPLTYGGFGALLGIPLGGFSGYISSKADKITSPIIKAINEFRNKFGKKVPQAEMSVQAKVIPSENTVLEGWNGTVGADVSKVKPSAKYQKAQIPAYKEQLEEALGLNAENWDQEPDFYSKEMEDEAYSILSRATGKSAKWIKSQLKGGNGKGMAKRREFIELLLEHTDDKLSDFADDYSYYNTKQLGYDAKDATSEQVGKGTEIAEQAYNDAINGDFNFDPRDELTRTVDTAELEYKKIMRDVIDGENVQATYETALNRFQETIKDLPEDMQSQYFDRFFADLEKAENVKLSDTMRLNGDLKKSGLAQHADLPADMAEQIKKYPPEYEVLHNNDLMLKAQEEINADPSSRLARLSEMSAKNNPLSAQDFEEARQLVGKLYQEGRIDEALELTRNISIAGSKAGQSVQAMSLWAKTTPEGAIRQAQKIIDEYNKTARKKLPDLTEDQAKTIIDMAQEVQRLESNSGSREKDVATGKLLKYFADLVPQSRGNKLKTLRNISLLLNPKTFTRNITGNAIFAGMENGVTKPIASGLDKLASVFTGKRTRTMPQLKEYGKGLVQGFKEGVEDVELGIDTRGIGGRFDLPQSRSFENTPVLGELEKALDYSLRVPDRSFYQATFNESLANQMVSAGVDTPTSEMLEIASQEALESVYQNGGKLSDTVLNLRRGLNNIGVKDFGLGDALVPYAQTPANVAQQGINYSPLGIVNAIKSGMNGNQRQATLDLARAISGTGIMGAGYGLSKAGNITPEIEDFQTRKNYEAFGERPDQIRLPDGSLMSYTQLQPLASPLSGGAILGSLRDGDYMGALDKSLGSIADLSMLRGLNDFTSTYNEKGIASALANTVSSIPSQFIGSGINQINAYVDPYQRETYDPNPLVRSLNQARAKTPFLSKTLPKKYDVTGSEIEKYSSKGIKKAFDVFVNPVFVNKPKDDIVIQEVTALYEETGEKGGLFALPEKKIKLDDGTMKQLNGREFSEYSKTLGEVTYKGYQKIMNTPRYANADDQTRLKLLEDIKKNAKAITQEELFGKTNKYSRESAIRRKMENRLNKGQNRINRILNKMDNQLVDTIMYEED